ncbi:hypothetical protein [Salmonella phage SSE121]|uniref:Uncharacterized protein n=1 Tax=Salmonella phage SSE121 TaxID=1204529 RepID=K4I3E2_9CAUD|nr:hypothetical protein ACQ19_gp061 [Salmonella phage SSE121]AFU63702.1 hypothetical protein [Salmonella phage SSE121]
MQENKILVWKTQEGNLVRLTHMSSEHLRNAISWLLREQNLDPNWRGDGWSDLSDTYEGVQLGVWVEAMTDEISSRIPQRKASITRMRGEWAVIDANGDFVQSYFFKENADELVNALNSGTSS